MVTISNGVFTATVTKGAYESIYAPQGYKIIANTKHENDEAEEWNNGTDKSNGQ